MSQVSVIYPVQRSIDQLQVNEIATAAGAAPARQVLVHKSNDSGGVELHALLKFGYTTDAQRDMLLAALKPFGEVRDLPSVVAPAQAIQIPGVRR